MRPVDSTTPRYTPPPPADPTVTVATTPPPLWNGRPEPTYDPLAPTGPSGPGGAAPGGPSGAAPYGGETFSQYVDGTQARELDVDMMRMSYATYDEGPDSIPGWTMLSDAQLEQAGMDPATLDVPGSQFNAEVFTDGQGNYVLAYRGTADGAPDWRTNFEQGVGLHTDEFDRLAPQVAQEFKRAFGQYTADANGNPVVGNLAITGHSQGGGLASVGSLVTGIPAVTFDASGLHPVTMERLGLDPAQARADAEAGQIRRYSMHEDALTQAQESYAATALLAPDALGHQIIVKPEGELDAAMTERALEYAGLSEQDAARYGGLLDTLSTVNDVVDTVQGPFDRLLVTPFDLAELPFSLAGGARDLARAGISHEQQLMIDTMLQQQPWQPGYRNPTDPGRSRFDLVPQGIEDGAQRLLHQGALVVDGIPAYRQQLDANGTRYAANEAAIDRRGDARTQADVDATLAARDRDVRQVLATDAARGDTIEAGWSIAGDYARAGLQVQGDRVSGTADTAADQVRNDADHAGADIRAFGDLVAPIGLEGVSDGVAGLVEGGGEVVADITEFGGGAVEVLADATGAVVEAGADLTGDIAQGVDDGVQWMGERASELKDSNWNPANWF